MYQIYETWYGDQEGIPYGQLFESKILALNESNDLNERHEGYLYLVVDLETNKVLDYEENCNDT